MSFRGTVRQGRFRTSAFGRSADVGRAVVFTTSADAVWGAERSMLTFCSSFIDSGIDVSVISPDPTVESIGSDLGIDVSRVLMPAWARRFRLLRASMAAAWTFLRVKNSILIVFHLDLLPAIFVAQRLLAVRGNSIVLDLHDYYPSKRGGARIRRFSRCCDLVVGVSEFVLQQVDPSVPRGVVVRPISRPGRARKKSDAGDVVRFLIAGRVSPDKGLERLPMLLDRTPSNCVFVIRGGVMRPSDRLELERLLDLAEMSNGRVVYEGTVQRDCLYDDVDGLLLLNPGEASGRVVAEAQMVGCVPVVPSDGGSPALVRDGETGFIYENALGPDGIAAVLNRYCVHPSIPEIEARCIAESIFAYSVRDRSADYLKLISSTPDRRFAT